MVKNWIVDRSTAPTLLYISLELLASQECFKSLGLGMSIWGNFIFSTLKFALLNAAWIQDILISKLTCF